MHSSVERSSLLQHPWRLAALAALVANVAVNYASSAGLLHSMSVSARSAQNFSLFTPAGYAFSIWGLIYGSTLVYSIAALLPAQRRLSVHDRAAPWLLLLNVLASVWLFLFTSNYLGPSVLVILAMLISAGVAYSIVGEQTLAGRISRWWRAPFSLWLGWLAVAALANLNVALVAASDSGSFVAGQVWACMLLAAAAGFALAVNSATRDMLVPLVVGWAAAAIAVARWDEATLLAVVASLVALKTLLWSGATLLFEAFPIPASYRKAAAKAFQYDRAAPRGL